MSTSGYLARLVQRATRPETGVRPRVASMFEPTGIAQAVSTSDAAGAVPGREPARTQAARREVPVSARQGRSAPLAPGALPNRGDTAAPQDARSEQSPAPVRPRATPVPWRDSDVPAAAARTGPAADEATPTLPPRDVSPGREDGQTLTTAPTVGASSVAPGVGRDQPPLDPSVVIPRPTPSPHWPLDPDESLRLTVPADEPSRGSASTGNPAAPHPGLPRLHPVRTSEPAAAKPEITVTIGRIEVLTPAPDAPAPRSAGPGKGATAPDLSQYLRDRSGR